MGKVEHIQRYMRIGGVLVEIDGWKCGTIIDLLLEFWATT